MSPQSQSWIVGCIALLQHCWTRYGQFENKIDTAEPETSPSFIPPIFKNWGLHYPQCNLTTGWHHIITYRLYTFFFFFTYALALPNNYKQSRIVTKHIHSNTILRYFSFFHFLLYYTSTPFHFKRKLLKLFTTIHLVDNFSCFNTIYLLLRALDTTLPVRPIRIHPICLWDTYNELSFLLPILPLLLQDAVTAFSTFHNVALMFFVEI